MVYSKVITKFDCVCKFSENNEKKHTFHYIIKNKKKEGKRFIWGKMNLKAKRSLRIFY